MTARMAEKDRNVPIITNNENAGTKGVGSMDTKRVVLYARVAYGQSQDSSNSVETQIAELREYARNNNFSIVAEFVDVGESGNNNRRPGLQEMMMMVRENPDSVDSIIVRDNSRLFRSNKLFLEYTMELLKYSVSLVSIREGTSTDDPSVHFRMAMLEIIYEHISRSAAEYTHRGMMENALQGYWNGGEPPLGYSAIRVTSGKHQHTTLEINENEFLIVERIFNMLELTRFPDTLSSDTIVSRERGQHAKGSEVSTRVSPGSRPAAPLERQDLACDRRRDRGLS